MPVPKTGALDHLATPHPPSEGAQNSALHRPPQRRGRVAPDLPGTGRGRSWLHGSFAPMGARGPIGPAGGYDNVNQEFGGLIGAALAAWVLVEAIDSRNQNLIPPPVSPFTQ